MIKISPSILSADFLNLGEDCKRMEQAGADMLHIDVMDGQFVPNISFGGVVIEPLKKMSNLFFDVHLMIVKPLDYIDYFVKAGADSITFHLEAQSDVQKTIDQIRSHGIGCALSIKPATPAQAVFPYLDQLDMVLVMTVEPGFGGQKFMQDMLPKIRQIRERAEQMGKRLDIQVDGGISSQTAASVVEAGANVLVAGSALFGKPDYAGAVKALRNCGKQ